MPHTAPPGARQRRSRLALTATLVAAAVGTTTLGALPSAAQQPVGVGPVPITFDLTDKNGAWFDSGLNLFGGQSLAVAVLPRLGTLTGGAAGGLPSVQGLTNLDVADSLTGLVPGGGGSVPLLGETGVDLTDALNLDQTLGAVQGLGATNAKAAPVAAEAESLLGQLTDQLAGMPADAPVDLGELPVGADLMGILDELSEFAVEGPPVTVTFDVDPAKSEGIRDPVGLIAPEGAQGWPFDDSKGAFYGEQSIQLTEPGLYAFADRVAPYMLGAVVVDDPLTIGLDFGKRLKVNARDLAVPSNADIIQRLVNAFFVITNPNNWQRFSSTEATSWDPILPPAPILQYTADGSPMLIPNLDAYYNDYFKYPRQLPPLNELPATPGVGEVWIDTQMEEFAGKEKSGAATRINVETWEVEQKISGSGVNMNNPHNMWTDRDYKYLYQSEWFDNELSVFDRETGNHVRTTEVGPNPAHVMTRPDTDEIVVGINAGEEIVELSPGGEQVTRRIRVGPQGEVRHPHAHWTSHDGKTVVTPNTLTDNATVVDMESGTFRTENVTGQLPIATSMTPDSSKFYTSNFLGQSITCISLAEPACADDGKLTHSKTIDLWENYNPLTGPAGGPWGGLTIQLPVSPDGKAMLAANTLSQTVSVVDPVTDTVVKDLPCNAGCHGVNFGAKQGGGYYGYVSNKFSNAMQIIDIDPNGDGDISDADVVGQMVLGPTPATKMDDALTANAGIGGQGVLPIPLVYNGWSQQVPPGWREKLTPEQLNPIG